MRWLFTPFFCVFSFNTTNNLISVRSSLSTNKNINDQNCTCYTTPYFRSEYLRNLNLLALIDTNLVNSKQKFSEILQQKLNEDPRLKMSKSSKHSMEISWLNLEMDLKNELFALVRSRQIQGDRNLKEKSKFLSDFRNYNESNLSRFISEERDYKDTIYNVTGVGMSNSEEKSDPNFFIERLNFFERKLKLENAKSNNSINNRNSFCFELTTNRTKSIESGETKRFSYFSQNFEEDFYRDAGVKANEVIGRKFSAIPIYDKPTIQILSGKNVTAATNKRKTWLGNDDSNSRPVKLESITGYSGKASFEKKKSETLPTRESASMKKLGIGPRSKSFVLPRTSIYSDNKSSNYPNIKLAFGKENDGMKQGIENQNRGIDSRSDTEANRFGFRSQSGENSPKIEIKLDKSFAKTKIPIGKPSNGPNSADWRSTSPIPFKEKSEERLKSFNHTGKKIPAIVSRKSMLIQSNSIKNEMKNNRRSLDSTKISLANMDKVGTFKRRSEKLVVKAKKAEKDETENLDLKEEKGEGETTSNSGSSKLPVR